MAISATLHTQKNLETHQNRLSRFFQQHSQPGQPAQAAPGGEYHTGLAGFPLADGAFVHIQPVSQLDVRQGDQRQNVPDISVFWPGPLLSGQQGMGSDAQWNENSR
ncbi:TPA: hypothetical protein LGI59_004933 [Escherichia coli]|nr:hypothetical protein [Escherichia coli]